MLGAACTTLLSEAVRAALIQYFVLREGFDNAVLRASWRPFLASLAMAALLLSVPFGSLWNGLLLGSVAYAVALVLCRGVYLHGRIPVLRT
jgi:hypothetical protein